MGLDGRRESGGHPVVSQRTGAGTEVRARRAGGRLGADHGIGARPGRATGSRVDDARCRRRIVPHPQERIAGGRVRCRKSRPSFARGEDGDPGLAGRGRAPAGGDRRQPPEPRPLRIGARDHGSLPDRSTRGEPRDARGRDRRPDEPIRTVDRTRPDARDPGRDRCGGAIRPVSRGRLAVAASRGRRPLCGRQRRVAGDRGPLAARQASIRRRAGRRHRVARGARSRRTLLADRRRCPRVAASRLVATGRGGVGRCNRTAGRLPIDRARAVAARPLERGACRSRTAGHVRRWSRPGKSGGRGSSGRSCPARTMDIGRMGAVRVGPRRGHRRRSIARRRRIASAIGPRSPSVTSIASDAESIGTFSSTGPVSASNVLR